MAGRIPQDFINDLLTRIDIVSVIDARVPLKKAGKNYQARCPFHEEKTPSFSVAPDKQFYHCFGCGASGTALTFLLEHDRMEFVEAVETLASIVGVDVPRERGGRRQREPESAFDKDALYGLMNGAMRYYRRQLKGAAHVIDYLKLRGLTGEIARDFGIGYAPDGWDSLIRALDADVEALLEAGLVTRNDRGRTYDRFRNRVMFPIRDVRGRVIAFGGRVLAGDDGPKYLNSPETPLFHKNQELYGLFEAREALRQIDRFLLVEGYMDVVALAQAGISNAVATLGTASGEPHFNKLFRHANEVVCCFDGDNAGRQAAWRALENALGTLKEGRQLKFMFLPDGDDPDTLVRREGRDRFLARVAEAQPAGEFLFARLAAGVDTESMDGRAQLVELARPLIDKVPPGALERLMRARLAELTGLSTASERAPAPATPARGASRPPERGGSRLREHLLTILLNNPGYLADLPDGMAEAVAEDDSLFGKIAAYLVEHVGIDVVELLGHFSGEAQHAELLRLLDRPLVLTGERLKDEFVQGVARYLERRSRSEEVRLLSELEEDFDPSKFERFWRLRQGRERQKD